MRPRDDFAEITKRTLAQRAGSLCTICKCLTSGPHTNPEKFQNMGKAAHICAAAVGGPRYDTEQTSVERKHINNGIWLCAYCADLIDKDELHFSVVKLQTIKKDHEEQIILRLRERTKLINETVENALRNQDPRIQSFSVQTKLGTTLSSIIPSYEETLDAYKTIAFSILGRGTITPSELIEVYENFIKAEEFSSAGGVLVRTLSDLNTKDIRNTNLDAIELLTTYPFTELPSEIAPPIQGLIRSLQISIRRKAGLKSYHQIVELDKIINHLDSKDGWAILPILFFGTVTSDRICKYYMQLSPHLVDAKNFDGAPLLISEDMVLESIIWMHSDVIQTISEIEPLLECINTLNKDQINNAFYNNTTLPVSRFVLDRIWLFESNKVESKQDWDKIIEFYNRVEELALKKGIEILRVAAVCCKIIVLSEFQKKIEEGLFVGSIALGDCIRNDTKFLISECIGRQLLFNERFAEADTTFDLALSYPSPSHEHVRATTLRLAIKVKGLLNNLEGALNLANDSIRLCQESTGLLAIDLCKSYGEAYTLCLVMKKLEIAFNYLELGWEALISLKQNSEDWEALTVSYCIAIEQLKNIVTQRTAIPTDYSVLSLHFNVNTPERRFYYKPNSDEYYILQFARIAVLLDKSESVSKWLQLGVEITTKRQSNINRTLLEYESLPTHLVENNFTEVISIGFDFASYQYTSDFLIQKGEIPAESLNLSKEQLDQARLKYGKELIEIIEKETFNLTALPIVLRLCYIILVDEPSDKSVIETVISAIEFQKDIATDKKRWKALIALLKKVQTNTMDSTEVFKIADNSIDQGDHAMAAICYLLATLELDHDPKIVCGVHLSILPLLENSYKFNIYFYRKIAAVFFINYWRKIFDMQRGFNFISPRNIEKELELALKNRPEKSVKEVMKTIASGLNVKLSPKNVDWLKSKPLN